MRCCHRRGVLLALVMLVCMGGIGSAAPPEQLDVFLPLVGSPSATVDLSPIGNPIWKPADIHLFAAPIGSAPDYLGFSETISRLLPEPNHRDGRAGAPHAPPYDHELADGVAQQGYEERRRYAKAQFSAGNGVYIVWMMLPAPGIVGSSRDFSSGPVIPQNVFPITISSDAMRNDAIYDPNLYDDESVFDDTEYDGSSHFPVFIAENSDFGPAGTPIEGRYEYRVTMTDQGGHGWHLSGHFTITP